MFRKIGRKKLRENKPNIRYLVLWLGDNRNLNCKYCYAIPAFQKTNMSFEIAKKAIELCKDNYPCSSFIGNKEYLMGNIQEKIRRIVLPSGKYENCVSCIYHKKCKGCCPSRMLLNAVHGEADKDCVLRKAVFQILKEEEEGKI